VNETSEQKKKANSPRDVVVGTLTKSIDSVGTLPRVVIKGFDSYRVQEDFKKGENQSQ
jgi:hypothetical protein